MRRTLLIAVVTLASCASIAGAGPAPLAEPYDLHFSYAWQFDRFHDAAADSLGHAFTSGPAAALGFDFRVAELPVGKEKPAIHVLGHTRSAGMTFATDGISPSGATSPAIDESRVFEMAAAVVVRVPISMFAPGAGADVFGGYEGGMVLTSNTGYDFMRIKRAFFGFERTQGFFEGSLAQMSYGRNESYGRLYAHHRWATRFRVQSRIIPVSRVAPAGTGAASAPGPAPTAHPSPLRAFMELVVDTNGASGPDAIQAQLGLTVDAGAVLRRVLGSVD